MIAWLILLLMVSSMLASLFLYIKSVQPAYLETKLGDAAYKKCERYRALASIPWTMTYVSYILFYFFPLPLPMPVNLPWDYGVSVIAAIVIAVPSFYLMIRGVKDAGEETIKPKKEHQLYGGIYNTIRHPQSLGEVWTGHILALLLNNTFLFAFSFVLIPIFYYMAYMEEKDLILRFGKEYLEYRERVGMFFPKRR